MILNSVTAQEDINSICQRQNLKSRYDIMTRDSVVFLRFHVLYLFSEMCYTYTAWVQPWTDSQAKPCGGAYAM